MSSEKLKRLLVTYNTIMWDIVRAYIEADLTEKELRALLVENDINVSTYTLQTYKYLYLKLKRLGYSDNVIDKRPPRQWHTYIYKTPPEEKK